jgi:site-specific DNA recombinase
MILRAWCRDRLEIPALRAQAMLDSSTQQTVTPQMVERFAAVARRRMRLDGGGYRRDHLRAFAQHVEVAEREVFIKGSKDELLRTLTAIGGGKSAEIGVPSSVPNGGRGDPNFAASRALTNDHNHRHRFDYPQV